jgi:hypothetical protein
MRFLAPARFTEWMTNNQHIDKRFGHVYRYHSRSDSHSKALCLFMLQDLIAACPLLSQHAAAGKIVYGINLKYTWPQSRKEKTIDLGFGSPVGTQVKLSADQAIASGQIQRVLFSCEAKTCMTEHAKSQPRIFDELSSSHSMVHAGDSDAIAAGITVVNMAGQFVSPLRQRAGDSLHWSVHKQPQAAARMVKHLRGLPIRTSVKENGFDAYATIVISCDNHGPATLWTEEPSPQQGEPDHYDSFVERIATIYADRFSTL